MNNENSNQDNLHLSRRHFLKLAGISLLGGAGLSILPYSARGDTLSTTTLNLPLVLNGSGTSPFCGIAYSPYRDDEDPDWGPYPTEDEIREDIDILDSLMVCPYLNQGEITRIRTYGCDHNLEKIPQLLQEKGSDLQVNAGCWLSSDLDTNETAITAVLAEAQSNSNVVCVTIGNETQVSQSLSETALIAYIDRVRNALPQSIEVTTGETWYQWSIHPALVNAVDIIQAHIYPYWETDPVPIDRAVEFIEEKYSLLKSTYPGKTIVIGETGWPSAGETRGEAVPSLENHNQFLIEFIGWARENKVPFYLFEAFDENWKTKYEGDVGSHWGIYDSLRNRKSTCQPL